MALTQRQGQLWHLPSGGLLGREIELHSDAVGVLQEDLIDVLATGRFELLLTFDCAT